MKKVLLIIVGILLFVSIPVTVYFIGQQQDIRKRAAPATTLTLSPASATKKIGETFILNAQMDTGVNQVVTAKISITYDQTKLEAQSITNGTLLPKIYTSGIVGPGTASITVGALSNSQPVTGTGTAAVVRFKALTQTTSPISIQFTEDTFVGGLREKTTNVLVGTTPASITITPDTTIPSITPEASKSALIAPSPTVTITPNTSPSATGSALLTLTPMPPASSALTSTSSAVTVTLPQEATQAALPNKPTFTGKAPPGSIVTIVIHSDPVTATVTTDENGDWVYTPQEELDSGEHTVLASAENPGTGIVETSTTTFTVGTNGSTTEGNPMPQSGSTETTILLLAGAFLLISTGFLIPVIQKR